METKRIRYRRVNETTLESTQTFTHPTNGAQYVVRLDSANWSVVDPNTDLVASSGSLTPVKHQNLKLVKSALRDLGVILHTERRVRVKNETLSQS